jgi:hypothetical protein
MRRRLDLPLASEIIKHLSRKDLSKLCLVQKNVNKCIKRIVLQSFEFHLDVDADESSADDAKHMKNWEHMKKRRHAKFIQHLSVEVSDSGRQYKDFKNFTSLLNLQVKIGFDDDLKCQDIVRYLPSSLCHLTILTDEWGWEDDADGACKFSDCSMSRLTRLRELEVSNIALFIDVGSLHLLTNLTRLFILYDIPDAPFKLPDSLLELEYPDGPPKTMTGLTKLTSLFAQGDMEDDQREPCNSIDECIKKIVDCGAAASLRELYLPPAICYPFLDYGNSLSQLRNLRSISINIQSPFHMCEDCEELELQYDATSSSALSTLSLLTSMAVACYPCMYDMGTPKLCPRVPCMFHHLVNLESLRVENARGYDFISYLPASLVKLDIMVSPQNLGGQSVADVKNEVLSRCRHLTRLDMVILNSEKIAVA